MKVPGVKKYLVVFGLGSAFCIGLNCLMMLSALALSSLAYSDVDMQTNVVVQLICMGIIVPVDGRVDVQGACF